ncbi:ABC transporter permease [Cohnella caldifontis]|uniref:ABC transporter permease n=1 Tax=Cohnella caldifontis TaxID=3027471 RepID=UPI0023EBE09D|nr:ABC transporter permease [Cohnella sp. YIM B05605]
MADNSVGVAGRIKNANYKKLLSEHGILIGFVVILIYLSLATPNFLNANNIVNVLRQVSCIGMATIGVGILIVMGGIDLAIGSTFALTGITAGIMVSQGAAGYGLHPIIGIIVGIATGTIVGGISGWVVAKARIPAFIVTMGTMSICRGLALIFAHGMPIGNFPSGFTYIGSESLGPIPWPIIIFVLVIIFGYYLMNKRPLGRYIYAVGSNEDAARAAGINVNKVKVAAYLISGALVGLGGTVLAARLKSAAPSMGVGYELDAIAGAIIGGVSFSGGIGKIRDMVIGTLMIGVINNGMDLLGVEAFYKQVVKGSIIILAVLIDRKRSGRA